MYNRAIIEARVLELFDAVKHGIQTEDSLIELKAGWIELDKAARRIAGHANAARGESILWIIGLDEEKGVCQINTEELSNWWAQVQSCFDGTTPNLKDLVVKTEDGPVYALCFDTTASPFVIKNPCHGKKGGGPVQREVPWREGTAVHSATREELVRILVPVSTLPDVEILSASVTMEKREPINLDGWGGDCIVPEVQKIEHLQWQIFIKLYVTPRTNAAVVFPVHRSQVGYKLNPLITDHTLVDKIRYQKPGGIGAEGFRPDTASVTTTSGEVIFYLPGIVHIEALFYEPIYLFADNNNELLLFYSVQPTGTEHKVRKEVTLHSVEISGEYTRKWATNKVD